MAPAYTVRARRGAPVSVPLDWDELRREDLRPDGVTIRSVFDRIEEVGDPWADFRRRGVSLSTARQKLGHAMPLDQYRKKNFAETPEPAGRVRRANHTRVFVVQKHAASRLHYDFRLAIRGVLVSWAVPRGPSLSWAEKRLAIRTEDHPLEYADFEGVIPQGQYGAGTVMVWTGRGKIDRVLRGEKLRGGFTLIQTRQASTASRQRERWLLVKHRDRYADAWWEIDRPELDRSVLTGRTLKEIESGRRGKKR